VFRVSRTVGAWAGLLLAGAGVLAARAASGVPATAPTSGPMHALDPKLEAILDRLERAGQAIHDLRVPVRYQVDDLIIGDTLVKTGEVLFRKEKPNAKFLIRFDETRQEDVRDRSKQWHLFDGRWYVEAQEKTKTIIRREIVPPGKKIDPFRIGQGPFPLPFGQKKQDILTHFVVRLVPPKPGDPPRTDHLVCIPREGSSMADRYRRLEFFVSRKVDLPVRIVAEMKNEDKRIMVDFPGLEDRDKHINTGLPGSAVTERAIPKRSDWVLHEEPLEAGPAEIGPAQP